MMDGESWTKVIVALIWIVIIAFGVMRVRRMSSEKWRLHRVPIIFAALVLLLPLVTLAARYGPVSCNSLPVDTACVCYAFTASDTDSGAEKRELFGKAADLCPGYAIYRDRAASG